MLCRKNHARARRPGDADAFSLAQAEDIINRGGGNLIIELWNAGAHEETENTDVTVTIDGCRQTHAPGSQLRLTPGESICLTPGLYHSFWGERGLATCWWGSVIGK
jgi:D-lyxose ketol-isomerase